MSLALALLLCASVVLGAETARAQAPEPSGAAPSHLLLNGTSDFFGASGEFSLLLSAGGEFRFEIRSEIPRLQVFDGQTLWERDWHGAVRTLTMGERESALLQMTVLSGLWATDGGPLLIGDSPDDEGAFPFQMKDGLLKGSITLNSAGQPERVASTTPGAEHTFEFLQYADGSPPHPTVIRLTGPQGDATTLRVTQATRLEGPNWRGSLRYFPGDDTSSETGARTDSLFGAILADDARVRWAGDGPGQGGSVEVMSARTGHHLVRAQVNEQDLGWFIFDTGAGASVLTPRVITALGLPTVGHTRVGGAGGVVESDVVKAESLTVGPMTLLDPVFVSVELGFLDAAFGVPIAGIVGYDALAPSLASIDLRAPSIRLEPAGAAADRAMWVSCATPNRLPCVQASVEGHEGWYRLDTGAAQDTVSFHAPTVQRLGLLEGRETTERTMHGAGGLIRLQSGVVREFALAGRTWTDLAASFATENVGAFADPYTDGNIGGQLIGDSMLWIDYREERIGFDRRSNRD